MTMTLGRRYRIVCLFLIFVWVVPVFPFAQDQEWPALFRHAGEAYEAGQYQAALELALSALQAAEKFGPTDVRLAVTLKRVGLLHRVLGRNTESQRAYERAISILEDNPQERFLLAQTLDGLSLVWMQSGRRYAQAERLMQRAVAIGCDVRGPDNRDLAGMMANLASAQMMLRKDSEAQVLFQRALAILEKSPPQYQLERAGILANLGFLAFWHGDTSGAHSYLEGSVAAYEEVLGRNHPELITPLLNLARLRLELRRPKEAEAPVLQAFAIAERGLGANHPSFYQIFSTYSAVLRSSGRKREARQMEARANEILIANPAEVANFTVNISDLHERGKVPRR
jgi:tetratricopeptide (TPR) repeat protein